MTLVCYQPPASGSWQGRADGEEPGLLRWHQVVQPVDLSRNPLPSLAAGQKGIAFLGFASDEGVRRNKGRTGAAEGPAALRKACSNFPLHFSGHPLADAGTITCGDGRLEMSQEALASTVNHILEAGYLPVVFGGQGDAGTLRRALLTELALELDHADAGRIEGELRARGVRVLDVAYDARVRLLLAATPGEVDRLGEVVAAATAGTGLLEPVGERWVDLAAPDVQQ